MTNERLGKLIYRHTGLSARQSPDEFQEVLSLCHAVLNAADDEERPDPSQIPSVEQMRLLLSGDASEALSDDSQGDK